MSLLHDKRPWDGCITDVVGKADSSTAVDGGQRGGDGSRHDWRSGGGRRRDGGGGDDQAGASDADTVEDSLVGDSDENPGGGRVGGRQRPSSHRHGHGQRHRPRHATTPANTSSSSSYRIFIALFDYNPVTMSPNRDAVDEELAFYEGQLIKVCICYTCTVFHKKGHLFVFSLIQSNDDQLTQNLYQL